MTCDKCGKAMFYKGETTKYLHESIMARSTRLETHPDSSPPKMKGSKFECNCGNVVKTLKKTKLPIV